MEFIGDSCPVCGESAGPVIEEFIDPCYLEGSGTMIYCAKCTLKGKAVKKDEIVTVEWYDED